MNSVCQFLDTEGVDFSFGSVFAVSIGFWSSLDVIQGPLSSNSHFLKTLLTFLFIEFQLSTYSNEPGVGFLIGPSKKKGQLRKSSLLPHCNKCAH